jgi:hypothetical protein
MTQETKQTVLNLLDELYEARAEIALNRMQQDTSALEIRAIEFAFDVRFRRLVNKIENLISQE